MLIAAKSFDGTRGVRFISYASHQMHQACRLELAMMSSPVRLPPSVSQGVRAVREFYDRPENARRRQHTVDTDEILETASVTLTKNRGKRSFVESAIVSQIAHRSLETPLHAGDDAPGATHKDRLADSHASADSQADKNSTASLVAEMVGTLPPREQYIVRRYFLAEPTGEAASLNEISDELGVTRERVRQLKNRAVEAMRKRWGGEISLMLA
jgi:RNA polymerase sigma factor (sigma-70 family)